MWGCGDKIRCGKIKLKLFYYYADIMVVKISLTGKPSERWGRKVSGLRSHDVDMAAGLRIDGK